MKYSIDKNGFYGSFGGAFVPEMLYPNLEELEKNYNKIINEEDFIIEYNSLLKDYVGRPTPLYFAERMNRQRDYKAVCKPVLRDPFDEDVLMDTRKALRDYQVDP